MERTNGPFVVIVDDDSAVLDALCLSFTAEGFGVSAFLSAEAALETEAPEAAGCLIVDHRLPGLDGLELVARLRARGVDSPAILITTLTPALALRARAAGVSIVEKPLLGPALLNEVRRATALEMRAD